MIMRALTEAPPVNSLVVYIQDSQRPFRVFKVTKVHPTGYASSRATIDIINTKRDSETYSNLTPSDFAFAETPLGNKMD